MSAFPLVFLAAPSLSFAEETANSSNTVVVTGTALKVETPLIETPRPASVVSQDELEEQDVQAVDEAFRYRAGVVSGQFGGDNDADWLKVRGFDQSTYQDGMRVFKDGYYYWVAEPYGLEQIDLLKGPSSNLYGEAEPGGLVNLQSKRPTDEAQGRIDVQVGNREHLKVGMDQSDQFGNYDNVRYRLVALYRSENGDLDNTESERLFVAPSLEWAISDATSLTLLASVQKDDAIPYNGFKPIAGTIDTSGGEIDPSTSYGEPDYDTNDRTQTSLGYEFSHEFSDSLRFQQHARYSELDLLLRSTYFSYASGSTANRGHVHRDGRIKSLTLDNQLISELSLGALDNTLLVGLDVQDVNKRGNSFDDFSTFGSVDLFNPVYGNYTPVADSDLSDVSVTKQQIGAYLQNQVRWDDRWLAQGGVRYDWVETENKETSESTSLEASSFSGGLMYLSDQGVSPYVSYTESFEPTTSADIDGDLYEPTQGYQLDAGVKVTPFDVDGYLTVSVFKIEEENALVRNGSGQIVQDGSTRHATGVEIEGVGYVTDSLQLMASYTYNDAYTDDGTDKTGEALIPTHQASVWADYAFSGGVLRGLTLGGGVRFVGETEYEAGDVTVPAYTLFDLMAGYAFADGWQTQVNVKNVTDETYVAACDFWCYYGESRKATASLSYQW
ncbi:TonB-dependent siderophore receptor [Saccharospirillum mangrovi]|uniref:TonB-dependent siderophore receptor n=1 Tax=Saccharospirillum mangrovi TaxID=2161747 RepID=UPI001F07E3AD|nr:TonB-dependent siderophore receptor [Saccharospirillum mangrovi]